MKMKNPASCFPALNESSSTCSSDSSHDSSSDSDASSLSPASSASRKDDERRYQEDYAQLTPEAAENQAQQEFQDALHLLLSERKDEAKHRLEDMLMSDVFYEYRGSSTLTNIRYSCLKNLGDIYSAENSPSKAMEYYLRASRIDTSDICLWLSLGLESIKDNNVLLSRFSFKRASNWTLITGAVWTSSFPRYISWVISPHVCTR